MALRRCGESKLLGIAHCNWHGCTLLDNVIDIGFTLKGSVKFIFIFYIKNFFNSVGVFIYSFFYCETTKVIMYYKQIHVGMRIFVGLFILKFPSRKNTLTSLLEGRM